MSDIKTKRNSLESYLREQIIGPGAGRNRILRTNKDQAFPALSNPFIENTGEALIVVPGVYYSSGILFPNKGQKNKTDSKSTEIDENDEFDNSNSDIDELDDNNTVEERNLSDNDEAIQMDQMFPKTMGLTFCMNADDLEKEGFEIELSARHYMRVSNEDVEHFGVRVELNLTEFQELLKTKVGKFGTLSSYFKIEYFNHFSFVKQYTQYPTTVIIDNEGKPELNAQGKQKKKVENILNIASKELGNLFFEENRNLFINFGRDNIVTIDSLLKYIVDQLLKYCTHIDLRQDLYKASQKLEMYQNCISHLNDAYEIYSGKHGVWESNPLVKKIKISNMTLGDAIKKIYNEDRLNNAFLTDDEGNRVNTTRDLIHVNLGENKKAALSLNLQLSKDTRLSNDLIYCKVQVINTSSSFVEIDNRYYSMANEGVNERSFFGVQCKIISSNLKPYNERRVDTAINDREAAAIRFLYREMSDYGIGHGCSVSWGQNYVQTEYMPFCDTPDVDPTPRDTSKPPVNHQAPEFLINSKVQQIKFLSTLSDATDQEIIGGLEKFIEAYGEWITIKKKVIETGDFDENEKEVAINELTKCYKDYERLKHNVQYYLPENSDNLNKFRLMNTSMFIQMWHGKYAGNDEIKLKMDDASFSGFNANFYKTCNDDIFQPGIPSGWRAFQLAFILLNLDGIFEDTPENENRNELVDLVWFPTGGGKTEAYLGLISLTILHRRMKYKERGGGTAAIMRYTLRLLTLQQFQRASKLIVALELMRRGKSSFGQDLGEEPIRIGLYVGDNQLPNKTVDKENHKGLLDEFENLNQNKSSKIPFDTCVCCGSQIQGYKIFLSSNYNENIGRLECENIKCAMRTPIGPQVRKRSDMGFFPFLLADDSIYQHPPTLLFGTVDKFAQLAHKVDNSNQGREKDSRRLFGRGNWESYKPNHGYLPPDLIIQDELHLLLGPLGTGVALFESAFEQLCTRQDGTKPKVISSTATTRNTGLQIEALFNKCLSIFPKPGIDCDDSFFGMFKREYRSQEINDYSYKSNRRYIGVLPTGRTQVWMQMRIAALCLAHRALFELEHHNSDTTRPAFSNQLERAQNYFYTVVSYFNSVKEVGRTQAQVQTYILKETRKILNRSMRSQKLLKPIYAMKDKLIEAELTGRLSGEEVKKELARVENNWTTNRFPNIKLDSQGNEVLNDEGEVIIERNYNIIPEFVVATNMISVGLDVSRFNTIVMNSMPRNTAEYIQASSRVARNDLGLVLTVHHPFKSRDLSHYEKFIEFHEKMYSYVEPISITPFTKKAVDKFMPLYVATIVRHFFEEFANRSSARDITEDKVEDIVNRCMSYFEARQKRLKSKTDKEIKKLLSRTDLDYIKEWIQIAIQDWLNGKNKADDLNLVFKNANAGKADGEVDLYSPINNLNIKEYQIKWQVAMSLRNIEPTAVIHINRY
jgi:hypothetical protein